MIEGSGTISGIQDPSGPAEGALDQARFCALYEWLHMATERRQADGSAARLYALGGSRTANFVNDSPPDRAAKGRPSPKSRRWPAIWE
jgi:hypothetical protein